MKRLFIFIITILVFGCGKPIVEPTQYLLNLIVNPLESGMVTGNGSYIEGEEILLSATPNDNYEFLNWAKDGEIVSTDSMFNYIMPAQDVELIANFIETSIENPVNVYVIWDDEETFSPIENTTVVWQYEINSQYIAGDTVTTNNNGFIIADISSDATYVNIKIIVNQMVGNVITVASINYTLIPCSVNNFYNPVNNNNPWGIINNYHYFVFAISDAGAWRIHSSVNKI